MEKWKNCSVKISVSVKVERSEWSGEKWKQFENVVIRGRVFASTFIE